MKTIDVIIPVYNTNETLLRQCIDSCLNQTVPFNKIIVVDDGSDLPTKNILREYDNKVELFSNINMGLSYSRNFGLCKSNSDYYMFLDSDDYVNHNTVEVLSNIISKKDYDIVIFSTVQQLSNKKNYFKYKLSEGEYINNETIKFKWEVLNFSSNISTAWGKLINRKFTIENKLLHNEKLKQGSEGIEYCFRLFSKAHLIYYTSSVLYNYVYNKCSISAHYTKTNDKMVINCFMEILCNLPEDEHYMVYNRFAHVVISTLITGIIMNRDYGRLEKREYLKQYYFYYLVKKCFDETNTKSLDIKKRVAFFACKHHLYFIMMVMGKIRQRGKN